MIRNMEKEILYLIIGDFEHSLTEPEKIRLQGWRKESPQNDRHYLVLIDFLRSGQAPAQMDTDELYRKLMFKIEQVEPRISETKTLRLKWYRRGLAAAVAVIFMMVSFMVWRAPQQTDVVMCQITVPYGSNSSVRLPDGSVVNLAAGSVLKYPSVFTGGERLVEFEGEAFFDIRKDHIPFVVAVNDSKIVVKGTRFNVKAHADDDYVETVLAEGAVTFVFGDEELDIVPNEKVVYLKSTRAVQKNTVSYLNTCIDSEHRFEDEVFEDVVKYLNRQYNAKIVIAEKSLRGLSYSGVCRKEESLGHILDVITATIGLDVEYKNGNIILKNKS